MDSRLGNRLMFYSEIVEAINIFGNIVYSVITGGFVHKKGKIGDVDIITVLSSINPETVNKVKIFAKKHVIAQQKNFFRPDFDFPTDIISRQQIIDAVHGRALEIVDNKLKLKEYSDEEIINNPEADYRVWLYEMITHDFDIIRGDFQLLTDDTMMALRTIFLYTVSLYQYQEEVTLGQIRKDLFLSGGLDYTLSEKQCRHLLFMMKKSNFGTIKNNILLLNFNEIKKAIERLRKVIESGLMTQAEHFYTWQLLRDKVVSLKGVDNEQENN